MTHEELADLAVKVYAALFLIKEQVELDEIRRDELRGEALQRLG